MICAVGSRGSIGHQSGGGVEIKWKHRTVACASCPCRKDSPCPCMHLPKLEAGACSSAYFQCLPSGSAVLGHFFSYLWSPCKSELSNSLCQTRATGSSFLTTTVAMFSSTTLLSRTQVPDFRYDYDSSEPFFAPLAHLQLTQFITL